MMESIEKLRELAADINSTEIISHMVVVGMLTLHPEWLDSWHKAFDSACDAIEREIAERFMELPLDADGVPVRVGDRLRGVYETFEVCAVNEHYAYWKQGRHWDRANECRHVKPRTLEDVLQSAGVSVAAIEDVAAEIRELMGGDA